MMNQNEALLWTSFQHDDPKALFTIYEYLYSDLLTNGSRITRDEELVKDSINQFFLYLWDKRKGLGSPQNLKSYILVSFKRKLIYEINHQHLNEDLKDDLFSEQSCEDKLIEDQTYFELQLKVKNAIDKLPPRQKQLILLRYYEGLSYEEIAKRTELSIRTVYNKLHEATKTLKGDFLLILLLINYLK